jgi:putative two-component system response regulator
MFELIQKVTPDLILLVVSMPEMDGFEALEILKKDPKLREIPVIFLTASQDTETEIRGFDLGVVDFISKPVSPPVLLRRIELHIETDRLVKRSEQKVRDIHNATIGIISDLVEGRDKVTGGHIARTQRYLMLLVEELIRAGSYSEELSGWDLSLVVPSAQLHDVGKICISDLILNKPGKLTDEEFDAIKAHCRPIGPMLPMTTSFEPMFAPMESIKTTRAALPAIFANAKNFFGSFVKPKNIPMAIKINGSQAMAHLLDFY